MKYRIMFRWNDNGSAILHSSIATSAKTNGSSDGSFFVVQTWRSAHVLFCELNSRHHVCMYCVWQSHIYRWTHLNDARYATRNFIFQMKLKRQYSAERYYEYVIRTVSRQVRSMLYVTSYARLSSTKLYRSLLCHFHPFTQCTLYSVQCTGTHMDCVFHFLRSFRSFVRTFAVRVKLRYGHCSYFNVFIVVVVLFWGIKGKYTATSA